MNRKMALGAFLTCLAVVAWLYVQGQNSRITELESQIVALRGELSGLSSKYSKLLQQLPEAESKKGASADPDQITSEATQSPVPSQLPKGLYVITIPVTFENARRREEQREYTIYHIKTSVGSGESATNLHIGVATSGMAVPRFYIDYDSDGQLDADMMQDYVYYLPFGKLLAKSLDPYMAQRIYDTFLEQYSKAEFTSEDSISSQGGEVAKGLWEFVRSSSDELGEWIAKNVESKPQIP